MQGKIETVKYLHSKSEKSTNVKEKLFADISEIIKNIMETVTQRIEERSEARRQELSANRAGARAFSNDEERKKGALKLLAIISAELDAIRNNRDLKKCEERLMSLDRILSTGELSVPKQKLQNARLELAAKEKERKQTRPKFKFKRSEKVPENNVLPEKTDTPVFKQMDINENQYVITSISKSGGYSFKENSDVLITDIHSGIIDISSVKCSTLHLKKVTGIVIKALVGTSIFMDELSNCDVHVKCQQLRMHTSENCTIHLDCSTRAIIEDSKGINFSPLLPGQTKVDNWQNVDDFNWLSKIEQSPNFSFSS